MKRVFLLVSLLCVAFIGSSCSSTKQLGPGGTVIKRVKTYHIQPGVKATPTINEMVAFERKHFMHGAYTVEQRRERMGHHYAVIWNTQQLNAPVEVVMEYTHRNTGSRVHTQTATLQRPQRRNTTRFRVTGENYFSLGPVTSWRATVRRGQQVLASEQSFLWEKS